MCLAPSTIWTLASTLRVSGYVMASVTLHVTKTKPIVYLESKDTGLSLILPVYHPQEICYLSHNLLSGNENSNTCLTGCLRIQKKSDNIRGLICKLSSVTEIRKHGYYSYIHPPKGLVEVIGIETHSIIAQSWPHPPCINHVLLCHQPPSDTHTLRTTLPSNTLDLGRQCRNRPKSKEETVTLKLGVNFAWWHPLFCTFLCLYT